MSIPFASATAATLLALALLTGCETPAGDVNVIQSDTTPVIAGSTYAWAPVSGASRHTADPRLANDILLQRIESAVDSALSAKGYRRVGAPEQAALLVSYYIGLQSRSEVRTETLGAPPAVACGFRGCVSGWGFYGPPMLNVDTINYTEGAMILDLVDRASGRLAWRATSRRKVDHTDTDQARLNAVLADMTKSLPGV